MNYAKAACKGMNPSIFFPKAGDAKGMNFALNICADCTIKSQCLEANIWEPDGVWGATSAKKRAHIRSKRKDKVRPCLYCSKLFRPTNPNVKMCSDNCRSIARANTMTKNRIKSLT